MKTNNMTLVEKLYVSAGIKILKKIRKDTKKLKENKAPSPQSFIKDSFKLFLSLWKTFTAVLFIGTTAVYFDFEGLQLFFTLFTASWFLHPFEEIDNTTKVQLFIYRTLIAVGFFCIYIYSFYVPFVHSYAVQN